MCRTQFPVPPHGECPPQPGSSSSQAFLSILRENKEQRAGGREGMLTSKALYMVACAHQFIDRALSPDGDFSKFYLSIETTETLRMAQASD